MHEQIALFDDAFHFRGAVSGALDGDDDLTLLDGDGKVPDDARVGVIKRVRDAEQGRRLAQRLPVAFFQGVEAGVPARGPRLAVVAGEQGDPRAIVLVDVQAEIFLNEAHTDFMMPLAAFGEPDVVQLRREVEPVPPDVVEPVELGEILETGSPRWRPHAARASANRP